MFGFAYKGMMGLVTVTWVRPTATTFRWIRGIGLTEKLYHAQLWTWIAFKWFLSFHSCKGRLHRENTNVSIDLIPYSLGTSPNTWSERFKSIKCMVMRMFGRRKSNLVLCIMTTYEPITWQTKCDIDTNKWRWFCYYVVGFSMYHWLRNLRLNHMFCVCNLSFYIYKPNRKLLIWKLRGGGGS